MTKTFELRKHEGSPWYKVIRADDRLDAQQEAETIEVRKIKVLSAINAVAEYMTHNQEALHAPGDCLLSREEINLGVGLTRDINMFNPPESVSIDMETFGVLTKVAAWITLDLFQDIPLRFVRDVLMEIAVDEGAREKAPLIPAEGALDVLAEKYGWIITAADDAGA